MEGRTVRNTPFLTRVLSAAAVLSVPLGIVTPAVAEALGANCSSRLESKRYLGATYYRAVTTCSWVASDTKVRAKLDRSYLPDFHSPWYSTTGTYSTGWYDCPMGCRASFEAAPR